MADKKKKQAGNKPAAENLNTVASFFDFCREFLGKEGKKEAMKEEYLKRFKEDAPQSSYEILVSLSSGYDTLFKELQTLYRSRSTKEKVEAAFDDIYPRLMDVAAKLMHISALEPYIDG